MNPQKPGIEWTHVWGRPGFTWNPVRGCFHDCKWEMPDGTVAICYAKEVVERTNMYTHGFEYHYWRPDVLGQPALFKQPAGIFLDSMSDLMGHWVSDEEIERVLQVCRDNPQHIFFLLTKNARRLTSFEFPDNVWTGASSPPDMFVGKTLSDHQKRTMMETSLSYLEYVKSKVKWMSFEPLSKDYSDLVESHPVLNWAVIGAASRGRQYFPPDPVHFNNLMRVLDEQGVPVFFKGNLKSLPEATPWREDFPREV